MSDKTKTTQFGGISIGGNVGGNVTVQQAGEDMVGATRSSRAQADQPPTSPMT